MEEQLPPNNHTDSGLECWYKETMEQVGWVLSMPLTVQVNTAGMREREAEKARADSNALLRTLKMVALALLKAKILMTWKAMGDKMAFLLALYERSNKTSVVTFELHQNYRIKMEHLKSLLDTLEMIEL